VRGRKGSEIPNQYIAVTTNITMAVTKRTHFRGQIDGAQGFAINGTPVFDSSGNVATTQSASIGTIATTSASSAYIQAHTAGSLASAIFSGVDALTASDSNYITFTITNLGQAGAGSTAMLATTPAGINTTKVTGGTAIAANAAYPLTLSGTAANLVVAKGDRLKVTATATGTLANTVTFTSVMLNYTVTG